MYIDTLNWRQSFAPALITSSSVEPEAVTGKCYVNGFDRGARPVLYLRPARENTTSYERQVKYFVWVIERALKLMPKGVDRYVVIMDFDGYSLSSAPPMSTVIEIMKIFSNHYPGKMLGLHSYTPTIECINQSDWPNCSC
jgi:4-nitrophenyl phosphatase